MVSSRAAEAIDVRSAVLKAATRLFAAHGTDGTAIQDVADVVGVTKPAVLHYFPSKEHLRLAVLDQILAHWGEALPKLLLAATASEDRFDAVFGELQRFFAADPDRARVLLRETLDRSGDAKRVLDASIRPWLDAIAGYIKSGQAAGRHFAEVDAEVYVVHIAQLVVMAAATATVTRSLVGSDAHARYDKELARIAKASLFTPVTQARAVSDGSPTETKRRLTRPSNKR